MNTARRIFLILFVFSTLAVLILFVNLQTLANLPPATPTATPLATKTPVGTQSSNISPTDFPDGPDVDPSSQHTNNISVTALIGSILTSVTSLVGFVTTTVITWRREKRESSLADIERKKLETELERSRLELEKLKKNKPKRKTKK